MSKIDRLFNSYAKRIYWLCVATGIIHISWLVNNCQVGRFLHHVQTANDVYNILDYDPLYYTFFGNLAICYLDEYSLFWTYYYSFGLVRTALLLILIVMFFSKLPERFPYLKAILLGGCIFTAAIHIAVAYYGFAAINAFSAEEALTCVRTGGWVYEWGSLIHIALLLFAIFILTYQLLMNHEAGEE